MFTGVFRLGFKHPNNPTLVCPHYIFIVLYLCFILIHTIPHSLFIGQVLSFFMRDAEPHVVTNQSPFKKGEPSENTQSAIALPSSRRPSLS